MAKKVHFEQFHDGVCSLWKLDEKECPVCHINALHFQNRVIGVKRNYLAEQAGVTIKKLIRVPIGDPRAITAGMFAVIEGEQFKIEQAQAIPDTIPRSTDLSLIQPEIMLDFDPKEVGAGGRI